SSVMRVIRSLLSDIGFPGTDDAPVLAAPRVDDDIDAPIELAETLDPGFAVAVPIVGDFQGRILKQRDDIDEVDFAPPVCSRRASPHPTRTTSLDIVSAPTNVKATYAATKRSTPSAPVSRFRAPSPQR